MFNQKNAVEPLNQKKLCIFDQRNKQYAPVMYSSLIFSTLPPPINLIPVV
jgi:hypothetical protein